tara:strand:+ start:129 stop:941 length:813 start_codon:yes stop_codon:yes gene_type:complete
MAFKKYDSSYKRTESPFTLGVRRPGSVGPGSPQIDEIEQNKRLKERDEKNKEKLLERAKGRMIKKAERKERKAKKRTEQGRERSAARKTRKATRIRKRAGELTADEVVAQRDKMRRFNKVHNSPLRKEKTTGGKIVEKVKNKAKTKAKTKATEKVTKKVGAKTLSRAVRAGGRLTGFLGLGVEGTVAAQKAKAKAYKKMDKRSPGTSKRLETGAYGNQDGVRGTFFSAMKLKEKSKPTQPKKPKSSKKSTKSKEPAIHNRPKRNMGKSKK